MFSRRMVGWSMSATMTARFVADALMMAIWRRGKPEALLHHSDRGSQYLSEQFQRLMADHGIVWTTRVLPNPDNSCATDKPRTACRCRTMEAGQAHLRKDGLSHAGGSRGLDCSGRQRRLKAKCVSDIGSAACARPCYGFSPGRVAQSAERVCEQHEIGGSKPFPPPPSHPLKIQLPPR